MLLLSFLRRNIISCKIICPLCVHKEKKVNNNLNVKFLENYAQISDKVNIKSSWKLIKSTVSSKKKKAVVFVIMPQIPPPNSLLSSF